MNTYASRHNLPTAFFLLAFALCVPLWVLGGKKLPLPVNLPVSAFTAFVPVAAASILCYRQLGFTGVKELLRRTWEFKKTKDKIWYVPALLLAPLIYVVSYAVMRLTGRPLPNPIVIPLFLVPVSFVVSFILGAGEELGWSGYAIDPMQDRWGALKASFLLGVIWAIWHSVTFVQTGNTADWIVWQCIKTVAMRSVIVWIYNKTGKSVFSAILYHATDNVSWSLFPNFGSHYDPFVTAVMTSLALVIVLLGWGTKASAQYRQANDFGDGARALK